VCDGADELSYCVDRLGLCVFDSCGADESGVDSESSASHVVFVVVWVHDDVEVFCQDLRLPPCAVANPREFGLIR